VGRSVCCTFRWCVLHGCVLHAGAQSQHVTAVNIWRLSAVPWRACHQLCACIPHWIGPAGCSAGALPGMAGWLRSCMLDAGSPEGCGQADGDGGRGGQSGAIDVAAPGTLAPPAAVRPPDWPPGLSWPCGSCSTSTLSRTFCSCVVRGFSQPLCNQ
jgi:hypothetical protein